MDGNKLEVEMATLRNEGVTFLPNASPVVGVGAQGRPFWLSRPLHLVSLMNLSPKACWQLSLL